MSATPSSGELRRLALEQATAVAEPPSAHLPVGWHASERAKAERQRRYHLLYVPLLRLVACALGALVALPIYNLLVDVSRPLAAWVPVAVGILLYPLACWLWVLGWSPRIRSVDLNSVFLFTDLVLIAVLIYFTGAEHSWLFFLPLLRVADQAHLGFARALWVAHAAPLAYLAVLAYVAGVDRGPLNWSTEIAKLVLLYSVGLYISFTGIILQRRHERLTGALRAARDAIRDLEEESRQLLQAREELRDLAIRDPLTGLLNRKGILDVVERGLERALSSTAPFSLVLADLDHFKQVNDRHGHAFGDRVLRRVASRMLASGRAFDAVGRIGGDEFLIALPNCDRHGAHRMADRIRQAVVNTGTEDRDGAPVGVGISLGTATIDGAARLSSGELIDAADRALYRAKQRGGNCVETAVWRSS